MPVAGMCFVEVIQELMNTRPHVARFYPAPQQEGGAGATIVELRE